GRRCRDQARQGVGIRRCVAAAPAAPARGAARARPYNRPFHRCFASAMPPATVRRAESVPEAPGLPKPGLPTPDLQTMDFAQTRALVAADMDGVDQLIRARLASEVVLINQIAEHIIAAGGKRLRPMLVLLAA